MKKSNPKAFFWTFIILTISFLFCASLVVVIIDPLMHFHKPIDKLAYIMKDEFYLNPGIAAHYDYDAVVAGDSSCQNFLVSEMKDYWGLEAVKLTNQGAPFSETDKIIRYAFDKNGNISMVIRPIDTLMITSDPDMERYPEEDYYLYDDNVFNDVKYLINIDMYKKCFTILNDTRKGKTTWNMDMYSNWEDFRTFNSAEMLNFTLEGEPTVDYSDEEQSISFAKENVNRYIIETAKEHPDTIFYVFMPPYHASYYKTLMNAGTFDVEFEVQKAAIECLLDVDNITIFSFADDYEITSDWYYYCDMVHSRQCVNSRILEKMFNKESIITKDNYLNYLENIREYYADFDYQSLLKVEE